jgi:hypothetical protein
MKMKSAKNIINHSAYDQNLGNPVWIMTALLAECHGYNLKYNKPFSL